MRAYDWVGFLRGLAEVGYKIQATSEEGLAVREVEVLVRVAPPFEQGCVDQQVLLVLSPVVLLVPVVAALLETQSTPPNSEVLENDAGVGVLLDGAGALDCEVEGRFTELDDWIIVELLLPLLEG